MSYDEAKKCTKKNFCSITRPKVLLVDGGRLRRGAEMVLVQWFQGSRSPCSAVGERKKLGSAHGSPYEAGNKFDNRDFHPKVRDVHEM